ncbi:metallopeptidase TldD-related protein [Kitasatospora atroaurantiaca]|uniref:Putative Zn-dependent protease n=1 Tax=Kitasatospora atroaurantiaca TaxID=285545 RepID=A0A561EIW2_9ACTN|nr:metallopeptidase TldD-related protein [Kitasatospora atroaurantiaca]TWE15544.1 putative Zn-dependent protease [Kitasatospora atroaurantiaca]
MAEPITVDPSPIHDALPGERLELVARTALRRRVRLVDGEVESVSDSLTATAMVRSSLDGSVGYATTSRTDPAALAEAVRIARRLRSPGELRHWDGPAPQPPGDDAIRAPWAELVSVGTTESVARLRDLAASASRPGVVKAQATWDHVAQRVTVAASDGRVVEYRHPEATLALTVAAADGSGRSTGTGGRTARCVGEISSAEIADEALEEALRRLPSARRAAGPAPATVDLVIAPRAAARLLAQIAAVFYGDRPDLDRTGLRAPGARVLAPGLSLIDDGAGPAGLSPTPCDDEGTAAHRTVLVDDGLLGSLLHDRSSPGPGEGSTGHGWMVPSGSGVGAGIAVAGSVLALHGPVHPLDRLLGGAGPVLHVTRIDDGSGRALDAAHNSIRLAMSGWLLRDGVPLAPVAGAAVGMKLDAFLARIAGTSDVRQNYRTAAGSTLRKGPAVHSTHLWVRDTPVTFREDM